MLIGVLHSSPLSSVTDFYSQTSRDNHKVREAPLPWLFISSSTHYTVVHYMYAVNEFHTLPRNQYLTGLVEGQRPLHLSSTKLSVVQMCFYMNLYMLALFRMNYKTARTMHLHFNSVTQHWTNMVLSTWQINMMMFLHSMIYFR